MAIDCVWWRSRKTEPFLKGQNRTKPFGPGRNLTHQHSEGNAVNMRMTMLLWGTLEGAGRTVPCELIAVQTSSPGRSRECEYSGCSVIKAPGDLPDGD